MSIYQKFLKEDELNFQNAINKAETLDQAQKQYDSLRVTRRYNLLPLPMILNQKS